MMPSNSGPSRVVNRATNREQPIEMPRVGTLSKTRLRLCFKLASRENGANFGLIVQTRQCTSGDFAVILGHFRVTDNWVLIG